jgi:hypothetical protein
VVKNGEVRDYGDKRFVKMAEKFVNIDELNINLIDSVNPFQRAFEVLSKSVTPSVLRLIRDTILSTKIVFSEEEALALFPRIKTWKQVHGKSPDVRSEDPTEKRLAAALLFLQKLAAQRRAEKAATETIVE